MEALIKEQRNLQEEIKSSFSSYIKNPSRKSVSAIKNRLAKLNDLWQYFEQNDEQLVNKLDPSHQYFLDQEYQKAKDSYRDIVRQLEQDLAQLSEDAQQSTANTDNLLVSPVKIAVSTDSTELSSTTVAAPSNLWSSAAVTAPPNPWSSTTVTDPSNQWTSATVTAPPNPWSSTTVTDPSNQWTSTAVTAPSNPWSSTPVAVKSNLWSSITATSMGTTAPIWSTMAQSTSTANVTVTAPATTLATSWANPTGQPVTTQNWSANPNQPFTMPNQPFTMPNQPFAMPNQPFTMPNQPFTMPNQPFMMPNQPFIMPNQQFYIPNLQLGGMHYNLPKLQPLTIPKFDGCIKKWSTFSDLFRTIIHDNAGLQNIQRMQYLIGYLEGEPARIIQHLNLSDSNYTTAINLLRNRYDNPRKMLDNYISTILDLKKVEFRSAKDIIVLADTLKECLAAISNLSYSIQDWGPIIVTIAVRKLDHESIRLFEESLTNQKTMPSLAELYHFLEKRHQVLDTTKKDGKNSKEYTKKALITTSQKDSPHSPNCKVCKEAHKMHQCESFKKLSIKERNSLARNLKICLNCLQHDKGSSCKSRFSCTHCGKKHHSLLHYDNSLKKEGKETEPTKPVLSNVTSTLRQTTTDVLQVTDNPVIANISPTSDKDYVLLATAMVRVKNFWGELEWLRIVVDLGSQGTFITENAAQRLGLPKQKMISPLLGLGDTKIGDSKNKLDIEIQPRFESNFKLRISDAIIIRKIIQDLPGREMMKLGHKRYQNLLLADPHYNINGPIDILINAEVYGRILKTGLVKGKPTAQNTELGWILFGSIPEYPRPADTSVNIISMISMAEIHNDMRKFWQIEDPTTPQTQVMDEYCELHYQRTHTRDPEGRYVVQLPFKENKENIGNTKSMAVMRFYNAEGKMRKNDHDFGTKYHQFLQQYAELGHMRLVEDDGITKDTYYLPHHAATPLAKFRVVFDGSCKPKNGISLNDALHVGPKLQQSLVEILNRWRTYKYVLTADIEKMFRQIKVHEKDQRYQQILYRSRTDVPLQTFQLLTVTYGTACATFLAVRTLLQLAVDEGDQYPQGKIILKRDFYVDDMMTGCHTFKEALQSQEQIKDLTKKGGFILKKWASNDSRLLSKIPVKDRVMETHEIKDEESIKTLGIRWSPLKDEFSFKIRVEILTQAPLTKRKFLSIISSIYDPIGWLSPFTVKTKIMMQKLWEPATGWDEKIPPPTQKEWNKICNEISSIEKIYIPRWIHYQPNVTTQIHGFCDASADAYSAVLYCRVTLNDQVKITLLTAKTRVTPLKMDKNGNTTIPRLELCGALLLAELLHETLDKANMKNVSRYAWSDSTTALGWIDKDSTKDRFISNRVKPIRKLTDPKIWRYVPGEENPADCASRGIYPKQLLEHKLWWNGPEWLHLSEEYWPKLEINKETTTIIPVEISLVATTTTYQWLTITRHGSVWNLLTAYSDFPKLVRILAYCRRFLNNASNRLPNKGFLTANELKEAKWAIFKQTQTEGFRPEILALKLKKPLQKKSKLLPLSPFIDHRGIVRVGGRLKNSNLTADQKHPIVLPKKHHITTTLIRQAHNKTLHGGRQLTAAHLNEQFWIINATRTIRTIVNGCIPCLRQKGKIAEQIMGNLPRDRVVQSPPFSHSGVDFTGEFYVRMSKGRGTKAYKSYVSLFICMATKAIHLELVSDLTADAFMAAYKRFTGRRGHCVEIFSDNGSNFVSANKKLQNELKAAIKRATNSAAEITAQDGTIWYFNPPRAAYLGGLFEAGIKSIKGHLKKVLGETTLTFEEFTTLLIQVEACVNSRPITPMTNDPEDLEALTPGHFLIGRPLINPPEADLMQTKTLSSRWKLLTKFKQDIWARWSTEYLTTLQQRPKWREERENLRRGDLVLIKEDYIAPTKWPLGRIQEIIKGNDGKVRVVHVLCKGRLDENNKIIHQILPRAINRICPLPADEEDDTHFTPSNQIGYEEASIAPSQVNKIQVNLMTTIHRQQESPIYSDKLERILNSKKPEKRDNKHLEELILRFKTAPRQPKRRKVTIPPVLWCTIILLLGLAYGEDKFENRKLEQGLYIETTGTCQLLKGDLRLEFTTNYTDISRDQESINQIFNKTKKLCYTTERIRAETQCESLVSHLQQQVRTLVEDMDKIKMIMAPRKKRGILGNVLQGVFGVNDEVYTDINALNTNQQILRNIMTQQNLRLTMDVNQTYERVERKLLHFNEKLNEVTNAINDMNQWFARMDMNAIEIKILATYLAASNYMEEMQVKYTKLTHLLLDHGNFLDIMDISVLHQAIESAASKLPSNLVISSIPQQKIQRAKINATLKIYAFMNIIDTSQYELLHITPIPKAIGNSTFVTPIIPFSTIAVNYNEQTYFIVAEKEFKFSDMEPSLCNPSIISNMETNPNCIIDEIYERKSKKDCNLMKFSLENVIWKQLAKQNTWLYIASKETGIAIICQGVRNDLRIRDVGVLKLNTDCTIKTDRNSLRFHTNIQQRLLMTFTKPTNFTIADIRHLNTSSKLIDVEPIITTKETLSAYLQPTADQLVEIKRHDSTKYTIGIIILAVIAILVVTYKGRSQIYKLIRGARVQESPV